MKQVDAFVGDIIKQKRREMRMTQEQLGKKVGLSTSTIACYELGIRGMNLDVFFKFCDILHLDPYIIQRQVEANIGRE